MKRSNYCGTGLQFAGERRRPVSDHSVDRDIDFDSDCVCIGVRPGNTERWRPCSVCGSKFSGATDFCPVCLFREALVGGIESGESSSFENTAKSAQEDAARRFEHYQLVMSEDGKPVELGRGAMGVTFKAFDVALRCPVALKVISQRYLGDESARLRFLREARAAARLRHSNVASVLQEEGAVTAKIIDLGLAKGVNEPGSETAISTPGAFVGTPDFASPEQFAGIRLDIRSDLYCLGISRRGAYRALAGTHYFMGDFETTRQKTTEGLRIWGSRSTHLQGEDVIAPAVSCLCFQALCEWHIGEPFSCHATMAEAIAVAKQLNDMHALAVALHFAAYLAHHERNPAEVERWASELIELSTRHNFALWLPGGAILRGWARSASGATAEGLALISEGIRDWRATGSILSLPLWLAIKAEAFHLAGRTGEALGAIREAEAMVAKSGERWWCAELYRLRALFLATMGADETEIETSFCAAINTANEQKSISLANRAKATYAVRHAKCCVEK